MKYPKTHLCAIWKKSRESVFNCSRINLFSIVRHPRTKRKLFHNDENKSWFVLVSRVWITVDNGGLILNRG